MKKTEFLTKKAVGIFLLIYCFGLPRLTKGLKFCRATGSALSPAMSQTKGDSV